MKTLERFEKRKYDEQERAKVQSQTPVKGLEVLLTAHHTGSEHLLSTHQQSKENQIAK